MFLFTWLYRLLYGKDAADELDKAPAPKRRNNRKVKK